MRPDMEIAYGAAIPVAAGIKLDKTEKLGANGIIDYTGSDRANDGADQKSQGGHVFLCNGGAISRQWMKQDLVAISTVEAEHLLAWRPRQKSGSYGSYSATYIEN